MPIKRNRLYALLLIAFIAGYLWLFFSIRNDFSHEESLHGCLLKDLTNVPCPSCGSTRSVISVIKGDFMEALQSNPLGYLIIFIMLIGPVWIISDLIIKRNSFYYFYQLIEANIKKPKHAIPLILLVIINWIWNVSKGL